ncbi:hypothetical protein [Mesorhizobium sp.]|uniref:hypothetical protein n=1 Tax=Mesorhizobium sp. TaxID=1871066 RepID=UPI000FE96B51|nr:hypothetical protein [Mesorhizobium sp.]RWF66889.1 MAG: hypothetical protein EOS47_04705 [Mesorhizobium sp.]TIT42350.1 MAG: hypothetical protein E5W76_10920 [Mesorhizobium sp.]
MAKIKLKHYVIRKGKYGYWLPTPKMMEAGFECIPCGIDGPDAWAIAKEWEDRWQTFRKGREPPRLDQWPKGSIGDAFARYRRMEAWKSRPPRTREDWERGWSYIEPYFADLPPADITLELLDDWYARLLRAKGVDIAYRAMKTWRALYTVMAGMKLCQAKQDPSLAIRRKTPNARHQVWTAGEAVRLVKGAWRAGFKGLACIIAVAWDTSFSPVDVRTLTPGQAMQTAEEWGFLISRTKSGESAFGTLSRRTQRLVLAYVAELGVTLLDDAPIFRSRGYEPGPKGGRPRAGVPYTKDSLVDDFADVRKLVFGSGEKRRLMDMRRSGAVEANAGGASVEAIAAKMGNSIDESKALQKTYMPVNLAAVRAADQSRRAGRKLLGQERNEYKKLKLSGK